MIVWILLGPSGVGKSSLGPRLAKDLSCNFYSLDTVLSESIGQLSDVLIQNPESFYQLSLRQLIDYHHKPEPCLIDIGAGTQWSAHGRRDLLVYPTLCLWRPAIAQWRLNQITRKDPRSFEQFSQTEYSAERTLLYQHSQIFLHLRSPSLNLNYLHLWQSVQQKGDS